MADGPESIEFQATVYKVQTLADNGIRVTLDLPERSFEALAKLASCQQAGVYLAIVATPVERESLTNSDHAAKEPAEESASKVGSGRTLKRRDKRTGGKA